VVEKACDMRGGVEISLQKFGQEGTTYVSKYVYIGEYYEDIAYRNGIQGY
jgi:hypothetical protein